MCVCMYMYVYMYICILYMYVYNVCMYVYCLVDPWLTSKNKYDTICCMYIVFGSLGTERLSSRVYILQVS